MADLTHLDKSGAARMVDVGDKECLRVRDLIAGFGLQDVRGIALRNCGSAGRRIPRPSLAR